MGYRLAGYRVVGAVEVDAKMAECYERNLEHEVFVEKIQDFKASYRVDQFVGVDVLDGSPPCTLFSMVRRGGRKAAERHWNEERCFSEGGVKQRLNDLFFDFVDLVERVRPRVVVAENVKGMIIGKAKGYAKMVLDRLSDAGYSPQLFLLNSAEMGVPQRRERVFFVAVRSDLERPPLELSFDEPHISVAAAVEGVDTSDARWLSKKMRGLWPAATVGDGLGTSIGSRYYFSWIKLDPRRPANTVTASPHAPLLRWDDPRELSTAEYIRVQSFPDDYDFGGAKGKYVMGMSVPPLMIERLATEIKRQWL